MKRRLILLWVIFLSFSVCVNAAELKNEFARQEGNRLVITYDLAGKEKEADVNLTLTVEGKTYKSSELHVEGDIGKVKTGTGKKISWNILQDFPRGLRAGVDWELTTAGEAFTDLTTGIQMVFVQGGCYQMGDTFGDGESDEKPVHKVCVHDFYMGKYEVTQGQWKAVMGNNPSNFSNCGDNCPVEQVSWADVQQFIQRLNSRSGKNYRLPTEAEWEYAARSGGKSEKWSGTSS
jgi:formylglycine-generating enzyme required for sulfatase activity